MAKSRSSLGCWIGLAAAVVALFVFAIAFIWLGQSDLLDESPFGWTVLGGGDIQVTLIWEGTADLDLIVEDPFGERVWFGKRITGSGGELDVVAHDNCENLSEDPAENINWFPGSAPDGEYKVYVIYAADCEGTGPANYTLRIRKNNRTVEEISATIVEEKEQFVTSLMWP